LETFVPRVEQVLKQTIRRGKAGKPVEYGRNIWLDNIDGGIVNRWEVLDGNPKNKRQ
jgi:hypothetical protein